MSEALAPFYALGHYLDKRICGFIGGQKHLVDIVYASETVGEFRVGDSYALCKFICLNIYVHSNVKPQHKGMYLSEIDLTEIVVHRFTAGFYRSETEHRADTFGIYTAHIFAAYIGFFCICSHICNHGDMYSFRLFIVMFLLNP